MNGMLELDEVESTNSYVMEHASDMKEWEITIARRQTGGRGRKGHTWKSPEGGLWMTVFLKDTDASLLPLSAGVAVAESIMDLGIRTCLKWPNDLLVGNKKIAGILVEKKGTNIALGIGINANFHTDELPTDIRERSTTILDETGHSVDIRQLATDIRNRLVEVLAMHDMGLSIWKDLSCTLGRRVEITSASRKIKGLALDVDKNGALLVRTEKGIIRVLAGDCRHI